MAISSENKNNLKALAATLLVHGGLFLLLYLLVFKNPDPPLFAGNSGVEVNFGLSEEGMGDIQPETPVNPAAVDKHSSTPAVEKQVATKPNNNVVTQQVEEAPVLEKETKTKPVEIKQPAKEEPVKQPVVNEKALFKKRSSASGQAGGEGETGKPGDQGIKDGSLYAKKHGNVNGSGNHGTGDGADGSGGSGSGKGFQFSLAGRRMMRAPIIDDKSQETGRVVVAITVDKYGVVTKAVPGARGSTTTSATLYAKAKEASMKVKFDAKPDAAEEQTGTITFVFIVQ